MRNLSCVCYNGNRGPENLIIESSTLQAARVICARPPTLFAVDREGLRACLLAPAMKYFSGGCVADHNRRSVLLHIELYVLQCIYGQLFVWAVFLYTLLGTGEGEYVQSQC